MIMIDRRIVALALMVAGVLPTAACAKQPDVDHAQSTVANNAQTTSSASSGAAQSSNRRDNAVGWSLQQFQQRRERKVMAADTSHDGRVSRAEFVAAITNGKGDPAKRFAHLDRNSDGFVDRPEIDTAASKRFHRLDINGDGRLTRKERKAGHASVTNRGAGPADDAGE
ncbi:signal transduction protein [Sphingomonas sp. 22L2VL55-3]